MISKIDSTQHNPNFGWINLSGNNITKNLAKRMPQKDFENLKNLIKCHKKNPVEVRLYSYDNSDVIRADIFGGLPSDFITDLKEGFFSRLFNKNPMKFIEKMAELGEKVNEKLTKRNELDRMAEELKNYSK